MMVYVPVNTHSCMLITPFHDGSYITEGYEQRKKRKNCGSFIMVAVRKERTNMSREKWNA